MTKTSIYAALERLDLFYNKFADLQCLNRFIARYRSAYVTTSIPIEAKSILIRQVFNCLGRVGSTV